jgi:type 1 glutamine amidotransferase
VVLALAPACSDRAGDTVDARDPTASTAVTTSTSIGPSLPVTTTTTETATPGFLVLHETAAFRHDSIPAAIVALTEIAAELGATVTVTDDSSSLSSPGLDAFAAVVFLSTTGDILTPDEQADMEAFIRAGRGFVGIHSATDTEYDWPWYGDLVGSYFAGHPAVQPAIIRSTNSGHSAGLGLPEQIERVDEWYNFRSPPGPEIVVLATVDESTYEGGTMGLEHPIAWAQEYDGGRAFYTAGGHTIESYSEEVFRDHIAAGLRWAAGIS